MQFFCRALSTVSTSVTRAQPRRVRCGAQRRQSRCSRAPARPARGAGRHRRPPTRSARMTASIARPRCRAVGHCSAVIGPVKPSAWGSSVPFGQGAHATGGGPHCAALHKIGLVKRRQNVTADALHHGQLPADAAAKRQQAVFPHPCCLSGSLWLLRSRAGRCPAAPDAQVDVIHGGVAGQNDPGAVHDGPARGVLGHGVAGGAGLGGLIGVVVGADGTASRPAARRTPQTPRRTAPSAPPRGRGGGGSFAVGQPGSPR